MDLKEDKKLQQIVYSCYYNKSREGEQFIPEHVFSYQISGTLHVNDGQKDYLFKEGDFRFSKRNNLIKFNKQPPLNGVFKALSIYFDQATLQDFSMEYGYKSDNRQQGDVIVEIKPHQLLKSFMESLLPYSELNSNINKQLQAIKLKEAILILLEVNPTIKNILFDFSEPGKIDLESFMNRNFHFNVQLKRFAYLTGRSLATFKRDLKKFLMQHQAVGYCKSDYKKLII